MNRRNELREHRRRDPAEDAVVALQQRDLHARRHRSRGDFEPHIAGTDDCQVRAGPKCPAQAQCVIECPEIVDTGVRGAGHPQRPRPAAGGQQQPIVFQRGTATEAKPARLAVDPLDRHAGTHLDAVRLEVRGGSEIEPVLGLPGRKEFLREWRAHVRQAPFVSQDYQAPPKPALTQRAGRLHPCLTGADDDEGLAKAGGRRNDAKRSGDGHGCDGCQRRLEVKARSLAATGAGPPPDRMRVPQRSHACNAVRFELTLRRPRETGTAQGASGSSVSLRCCIEVLDVQDIRDILSRSEPWWTASR